MDTLFTPWRYPYISVREPASGCFLCEAARDPDDPARLVLRAGRHFLVMLNRYPYSNGHVMLAPREHLPSPQDCDAGARTEFWPLVLEVQGTLERIYAPDGFNLGMNLGRAAGAGVPEHFHFHVVPRWHGDTNFMSAVGQVRLVPEDLESVWRKLRAAFAAESARR